VEDPKDADALAWVFKNSKEFVPYYFKFPPLGETSLRAKILYTGICHSDSSSGRGLWGPVKYPLCTGHEVIGQVIRIGDKVKKFQVGDMVAIGPFRDCCHTCENCKEGDDQLCTSLPDNVKQIYGIHFGGYCTHFQHPEDKCFHLPKDADLSNYPPVLCAGTTVHAPMKRHITKKNAKVGILGIGGLGHLAIQYAKLMGHEVTAFTTTPDKSNLCRELGATEVVVVDKELTELKKHERQFDYLLSTIPAGGFKLVEAHLAMLKNKGAYVPIGLPSEKEHFEASYLTLAFRQLTIFGTIDGSIKDTEDAIAFHHKSGAKVYTEMFAFEDFPLAVSKMENDKPHFRCVVNVKDFVDRHFPTSI